MGFGARPSGKPHRSPAMSAAEEVSSTMNMLHHLPE
jgi:hypothetical protein